jgi:hypothetical protein
MVQGQTVENMNVSDPWFHGFSSSKGSLKNKFAELALRFGLDLSDPIKQNHRNS